MITQKQSTFPKPTLSIPAKQHKYYSKNVLNKINGFAVGWLVVCFVHKLLLFAKKKSQCNVSTIGEQIPVYQRYVRDGDNS